MNLTNDSRAIIGDEELMSYVEPRITEMSEEKLIGEFKKRIEERYEHLYTNDEERDNHFDILLDNLDNRVNRLLKRAYVVFDEEEQ